MFPATLQVVFLNEEQKCSAGFARLDVELPFAPSTDIEFEYPVWHEPRKPSNVSFNQDNGTFFISFPSDKLDSDEHVKQHAEAYRSHGWTVEIN